MVGFCRRNYMVPIPEAADFEELNARLLEQCHAYGDHIIAGREQTVTALHEQEQAHLLELPETSFSNVLVYTGRVDKYSTVIVDKNRYSVPTGNVGLEVSVSLGADRILIHYKQQELASHKRLYGNNKWQLDPDHYLDLIYRKPGAFENARPILQWRSTWPECLEQLLRRFTESQGDTKGIKDFFNGSDAIS